MKPNCHRATDLWPTDSAAPHRHAAVVIANERPLRIQRHDSAPAARFGRSCSTAPVLTYRTKSAVLTGVPARLAATATRVSVSAR